MNFRQKITLSLLLYIVLGNVAFAQVVEIPDPNLRAAIRDALNLPAGDPITQSALRRLTQLEARDRGITELSGLEFATNLEHLELALNPISDLTPLAKLAQLHTLWIWRCEISDINPLASLTGLKYLDLSNNRIVDISPLANLTNLVELLLNHNQIVDVNPLANLTNLPLLYIEDNLIADYSSLDVLSLTDFRYDEICEGPPSVPVFDRIGNRTYPSVFTFFGEDLLNRPDLSYIEKTASHDLWCCSQFGLDFKGTGDNIKMGTERNSLDEAIQERDELLAINPNMIFMVNLRMRAAWPGEFPEDSPYLVKDANGNAVPVPGYPGTYLLDFTRPDVQELIIQETIAVSKCGLFDGVSFDFWHDNAAILHDGGSFTYVGLAAEQRARDTIIQRIRAETRPDFLIVGNSNRNTMPRTGQYMNGSIMETNLPLNEDAEDVERGLAKVEDSLRWLERNLKEPQINGLEASAVPTEPPDSPNNLRWMRALTALSLTFSDGYVVFNKDSNQEHYWYDFWDADLGRPVGPKSQLYDEDIPGLYIREFTNGWAVYNHSGEAQEITLPELVTGVASELEGTTHTLPNLDGEMYLRVKTKNPADVNGDGVVNVLDLTLVGQSFGTDKAEGDVNGDGFVNVFDLVFVANQL